MICDPEAGPNGYKLVLIASMPRSGSMWTYNVARELLGKSGLTVKPDSMLLTDEDQMRSIGAAMRNQDRNEIHCIKTHLSLDFAEQALAHTRILTPYRDPRDAVLSFTRFMGVDLDHGLKAAREMMSVTDYYLSLPDEIVCGFKYEDMIRDPRKAIGKIAEFLGIPACEEEIETIDDMFCKANVKTLIENIGNEIVGRNPGGEIRKIDRKTGFQTAHIAAEDGKSWSDVFSEAGKAKLRSLTHDWLVRRGYSSN